MPLRSDRLRESRERKGLRQRDLARLVGLSEFQISRLETGKGDTTGNTLEALVRHLGVSADYLLGLTDVPTGNYELVLRLDENKLLEAYNAGDSAAIMELVAARLREGLKSGKDER